MYQKGKRKETLPPYAPSSNYPSVNQRIDIPASHNLVSAQPRYFNSPPVGRSRRSYFDEYVTSPIRTFSGDSLRRLASAIEPYSPYIGNSILGERIHDAPEPMLSPAAPPPPSYFASVKPMLLWLDGGGNKVVIETHFLEDLMHKLAWDLKLIPTQPGMSAHPVYSIPPKDCFDWVASCGCGAIIAFAIACGMRVKETRDKFLEMTPSLRSGSEDEIYSHLESMVQPESQYFDFDGKRVKDSPSLVNIWVPAESDVTNKPGICVLKAEPLRSRLLPLVMREVKKELNGTAELLDCTVPFLHDVCPIFEDCSFLLSVGSGEVPRPSTEQTWWDWWWGQNAPSVHPPLPPCLPPRRNNIIPPKAYNNPATFIRLNPRLAFRSEKGTERPDDWTTDLTEILAMTLSFIAKEEVKRQLDRIVDMLKWKEIKPERKEKPEKKELAIDTNQAGTSQQGRYL